MTFPVSRLRSALLLSAAFGAAAVPASASEADGLNADGQPTTVAEVTVYGRARAEGYAVESTATATRTDTELEDTPQSIAVITRQAIEDQAMNGPHVGARRAASASAASKSAMSPDSGRSRQLTA